LKTYQLVEDLCASLAMELEGNGEEDEEDEDEVFLFSPFLSLV